jgi:hypothetical protein
MSIHIGPYSSGPKFSELQFWLLIRGRQCRLSPAPNPSPCPDVTPLLNNGAVTKQQQGSKALPKWIEDGVRGDTIQYIYTDAAHTNPLRRVTPIDFIDDAKEQGYDKEKYREMLIEAAETVVGHFGFDRTLYGDTSRDKNRKWWHQLKNERRKDGD